MVVLTSTPPTGADPSVTVPEICPGPAPSVTSSANRDCPPSTRSDRLVGWYPSATNASSYVPGAGSPANEYAPVPSVEVTYCVAGSAPVHAGVAVTCTTTSPG